MTTRQDRSVVSLSLLLLPDVSMIQSRYQDIECAIKKYAYKCGMKMWVAHIQNILLSFQCHQNQALEAAEMKTS